MLNCTLENTVYTILEFTHRTQISDIIYVCGIQNEKLINETIGDAL